MAPVWRDDQPSSRTAVAGEKVVVPEREITRKVGRGGEVSTVLEHQLGRPLDRRSGAAAHEPHRTRGRRGIGHIAEATHRHPKGAPRRLGCVVPLAGDVPVAVLDAPRVAPLVPSRYPSVPGPCPARVRMKPRSAAVSTPEQVCLNSHAVATTRSGSDAFGATTTLSVTSWVSERISSAERSRYCSKTTPASSAPTCEGRERFGEDPLRKRARSVRARRRRISGVRGLGGACEHMMQVGIDRLGPRHGTHDALDEPSPQAPSGNVRAANMRTIAAALGRRIPTFGFAVGAAAGPQPTAATERQRADAAERSRGRSEPSAQSIRRAKGRRVE